MNRYGPSGLKLWAIAVGLALACPLVYGQGVVINEFLAQNAHTLADESKEYDDWIELYNPTASPIDVGGFYLTDTLDNPKLWQIPTGRPQSTTIGPGGYLLIWADMATTGSALHAGFKLDAAGEAIGLFGKDGITLVDSVVFPEQRVDVSYGRDPDGSSQWLYFGVPTPGKPNSGAFLGVVADSAISYGRGFYNAPFFVEITTETDGATIRYTLDGSSPFDSAHGLPGGKIYNGPISITTTTCLRAIAMKPGWMPSHVVTCTYFFLNDVIKLSQSAALAAGYPGTWYGSYPADYEMDPEVVNDPKYKDLIKEAMLSIPTLSLATGKDNFFSQSNDPQTGGIYIYTGHSSTGGQGWERPVSTEFITVDGSREFQIDCGIRIQGGENRNPIKCPKHSFGLRFRGEYGPTQLAFPLFDNSSVKTFDSLELRGFFNNSWVHWDPSQRQRAQYIHDQWMRDSLTDMGQMDAGQGFFAHLYINGIYWGLYNVEERPVASHYAAYNGGEADRIDAIKGGSLVDGTITAWNELKAAVTARNWDQIQKVLDVDNFIDWNVLQYFAGNQDLKTDNNWRAAGGGPDRRPWRFYSWDGERVLESVNQRGIATSQDPTGLFNNLTGIEEFRIRFGDRVHRHLLNGGSLTPQRNAERWMKRAAEIDLAVIAESARWGDYRRDVQQYSSGPYYLYTKNDFWTVEQGRLLTSYFPTRNTVALQQFKDMGLYPSIGAPVFNINGSYRHGGHVLSTDSFSMTGTSGKIYYTTDGSEPRWLGTSTPPAGTALVTSSAPKRALVPTGPVSDNWRGGATFDDSAWASVTGSPGGVGYDRNPSTGGDYRPYISQNVETQMYGAGKNATCYIRVPFTVIGADLGKFNFLTLKMLYDDGFVAYLNGTEVSRAAFTGTPAWNSTASTSRSAGTAPVSFDLSGNLWALRSGGNMLAVHGLNSSTSSDDFLIWAELSAGKTTVPVEAGVSPTAVEYKGPITLAKSVRVKARVKSGDTWSALNEAVYAVGPVAESLRITEIMYHPKDTGNPSDPNTEFIELTNIGVQTINLNLVQFTNGVDFTFGDMTLQPNKYILVVKDLNAFTAKYGQGLPIAGTYAGSLDNAGERIRLEDAVGKVIHDFQYSDGWYDITDGSGFSLTVKDPAGIGADPGSPGSKSLWRASANIGGSPGY